MPCLVAMADNRPLLLPSYREQPCLTAIALHNRAIAKSLGCQFRFYQCVELSGVMGPDSRLFCKVPLLAELAVNASYDNVLFVDSDAQLLPWSAKVSLHEIANLLFTLPLTTARLLLAGAVEAVTAPLHNVSVITSMTKTCGSSHNCGKWVPQTNLHCTCIMLWRLKSASAQRLAIEWLRSSLKMPSPGPCGDQNNFNQAAQQHGGVAALPASLFSDSRATNVDECQRLPWQRNDDVLRAALASSTGAKAGIANSNTQLTPWQNGRLVVHKLACPPLVHEHHQLVADAAVVFRVNATIHRLMHQFELPPAG